MSLFLKVCFQKCSQEERVETSLPVCFSPEDYLDKFWIQQVLTCHLKNICCLGRFEITFKRQQCEHLKFLLSSWSQLQKLFYSFPLSFGFRPHFKWFLAQFKKKKNYIFGLFSNIRALGWEGKKTPLFRKVDAIVSKWSVSLREQNVKNDSFSFH